MQKLAVVSGAGSGIGRAVAIALAAASFRLVLTGRRRAPLEDTAQQMGQAALVLPADVTDAEAVAELFAQVREQCARIDLLFNNAGVAAAAVCFEDAASSLRRAPRRRPGAATLGRQSAECAGPRAASARR